jgi:hypothetical protein
MILNLLESFCVGLGWEGTTAHLVDDFLENLVHHALFRLSRHLLVLNYYLHFFQRRDALRGRLGGLEVLFVVLLSLSQLGLELNLAVAWFLSGTLLLGQVLARKRDVRLIGGAVEFLLNLGSGLVVALVLLGLVELLLH